MASNEKNHPEKSIGNQLKSIYQDRHGDMPDMSQLQQKKGWGKKKWLIGLLVLAALAAAAAWIGFLWFPAGPSFLGTRVSLKITAPFTVHSGEEITYTIAATNDETLSLTSPKMTVRLPNGFLFKESSITGVPEKTSTGGAQIYYFTLNDLAAKETSTLTITGRLIGEIGQNPTISARLAYTPTGSTAQYESAANFSSEIIETLVKVTANYQNQITQDAPATIDVTIKNLSETYPLESLKMSVNFPEDFKFTSLQASSANQDYQPGTVNDGTAPAEKPKDATFVDLDQVTQKTFAKENFILISGLAPNQEASFRLIGSFSVAESGARQITFSVLAADATNNYVLQSTEVAEFQVIKGEMLATLILNGSSNSLAVNFDSPLTFLATIKNKSATPLGGITVRMVIDSQIVDWKTLSDKAGGTVGTNQILWGDKQIPGLKLMLPEDEIQIPFSLKTLPYDLVKDLSADKYKVAAFFEVSISSIDNADVAKTLDSNTIQARFNSNVQLSSTARYFDDQGTTIGSGPLPPKVGEKTTYVIFWKIDNSFHELENVSLNADLPEHVTWEGQTTSDAGTIDISNRTVTWQINRMPTSVTSLNASFKISVTPTESDINKILTLLGETKLTSTDKETEGTINLSANPLTTDLPADKNAAGKSLVQPKAQ